LSKRPTFTSSSKRGKKGGGEKKKKTRPCQEREKRKRGGERTFPKKREKGFLSKGGEGNMEKKI